MNKAQEIGLCTLLLVAFAPTDAAAYCVNGRVWSSASIPVWVQTSGTYTVSGTGLSTTTVVSYTKAAIQEINRSSGFNRKLYFAGEVSQQFHGQDGITIYATYCGSQACGANFLACTWAGIPDVYIGLYPTGCSQNPVTWAVTPPGTDLQSVLAHELGHAIGLNHSNEVCSTSQNGTTRGVMHAYLNGSGAWRWLRRDDIEGLRSLYGTRNRNVVYRYSSDGDNWSSEYSVPSTQARTPVSATDPTSSFDTYHAIAYAGTADYASWKAGDLWSWHPYHYGVVDSSNSGKTWNPVVVANSPNGTMVAWIADETATGYDVRVRWALFDGIGSWTYHNGPQTTHKELGITYDSSWNVYLLSYMDGEHQPKHLLVDPSAGNTTTLTQKFAAFGGAACEQGTGGWCLTPASTTDTVGPRLQFVHGLILFWTWIYGSEIPGLVYSFGKVSLTHHPVGQGYQSRGYVGSFVQADSYAWLYRKPVYNQGPQSLVQVETDYWPIGVGAMTILDQLVEYRAYYGY